MLTVARCLLGAGRVLWLIPQDEPAVEEDAAAADAAEEEVTCASAVLLLAAAIHLSPSTRAFATPRPLIYSLGLSASLCKFPPGMQEGLFETGGALPRLPTSAGGSPRSPAGGSSAGGSAAGSPTAPVSP